MFKVLEQLHKQPKDVRRQVGFIISAVATILIFLIWIATFTTEDTSTLTEENVADIATPFETVGESFSRIITGVKVQFSDLTNE